MVIQYQRNFGDYQEAFAAQQTRPLGRRMVFVLVGGVIYVLGSAALVASGIKQAYAMMAIAACTVILGVISYAIRRYWLRRDFRRHPNFARPVQMRIDDTDLYSESDVWSGRTKWSAFVKYSETENLFLLYLGSRSLDVIPKRAFSCEQIKEFRHLLRTKLPDAGPTSAQRSACVGSPS